MLNKLKFFVNNEEGADVVEYVGLIAVAIVLIIGAKGIAEQVNSSATGQIEKFNSALNGGGTAGGGLSGSGTSVPGWN